MIRVTYEPREHRLRVEGHALAAPAGEDLVCAAASALAWTLVRAATARKALAMHKPLAARLSAKRSTAPW